jgi:predicted ArsR family transcriptional regulator
MTDSKRRPQETPFEEAAPELDSILHQPVRTRMVAFLAARGEATFNELKRTIGITDGNLDAHMKKLVAAEYVTSRREADASRPQTFYSLTRAGSRAFHDYVKALQSLLGIAGGR